MSVNKSDREPSKHQYLVTLQHIEYEFVMIHNKIYNEDKQVDSLLDHLLKLSMEAYDNATMYHELQENKIPGAIGDIKKYCKKTMYSIRGLNSQITVAIKQRMHLKKPYKFLVIMTKQLYDSYNLLYEQLKQLNKEEKNN